MTDTESSTITTGDQRAENASTVVDVLVKARKLIEKPENWTQGFWGKNATGGLVGPGQLQLAKCFCIRGAIWFVAGDKYEAAERAVIKAARLKTSRLARWNDTPTTTHTKVIAALDRAIAAERAKSIAGHP